MPGAASAPTPPKQRTDRGLSLPGLAPNAPKITLIGDFNHWDLQATPMEKIEGGIWEVFVPGLQRYDAYQYAVFQADGSYVARPTPSPSTPPPGPMSPLRSTI